MKTATIKASGRIHDPLQWKGHDPPTIRLDYWDAMCDKWVGHEFWNRLAKAAQNRAKMPDAHLHTGGSRTFRSHEKKTVAHQYIYCQIYKYWCILFNWFFYHLTLQKAEKGGIVPYKNILVETHKRKSTREFVSEKARVTMVWIYCINKHYNRKVTLNIVILNY